MANIVGNDMRKLFVKFMQYCSCIVFALLLFFNNKAVAAVDIVLKTMDERPLKQAAAGQSFLLVLTAPGDDTRERPTIKGLQNVRVESTNTMLLLVNNRARRTYKYRVRIDKPGEYILGPAEITVDGHIERSKTVKVNVGERQETAARNESRKALLRFTAEKSHVVVGEKIRCKLTFYGVPDVVFFERFIRTAPCDRCSITGQEGPFTGAAVDDGITFETVELHFDIIPNESGRIVIPAYMAEYSVFQDSDDSLSAFSFFFRQRRERSKIYSNACTLHVDPLPVNESEVDAVGSFIRFHADIKPSVAKVGEGMVLTLELEGDGNLDAIDVPELKNIPERARWYESKQYVADSKRPGMQKRCYEYIIQMMDSGEFELAPQEFIYFDIKSRTVQTLQTTPLHITIQKNPHIGLKDELVEHDDQLPVQMDADAGQATNVSDDLAPLHLNGWFNARQRSPIAPSVFLLLFLMPLAWLLFKVVRLYRLHHSPYFIRSNAFRTARKELAHARAEDNTRALHAIFLCLYAARLSVHKAVLSQEYITHYLQKSGLQKEKINEWNDFFNQLGERLFFGQGNKSNDTSIWEQAELWIKELESVI